MSAVITDILQILLHALFLNCLVGFFVELIGLNRSTDFSSLKSANNLQHSP